MMRYRDTPRRRSGRIVRTAAACLILASLSIPSASAKPVVRPAAGPAHRSKTGATLPNILLLVSDDQAWSTFSSTLMPQVYAQLVDKGVLFTRAYVNNALCCPSRAQILTGLYEHHTGVDSNSAPLARPTFIEALHDLGYATSLTGKYLNSEPCTPQPYFDQWVCSSVRPSSYTYRNPFLNVNGTWTHETGYTTDILANFTTTFIAATPDTQPFFAMYTPTSPHLPAHDDRCYSNLVDPYRPPNYDEDTQTDGKPAWIARPALSPSEVEYIDGLHHDMTTAVQCLDNSMATILNSLGTREDNTLVFYLSDNGVLYGEHRRWLKRDPYEPAINVPMVIRYPALVPEDQPFTSDALVENVDIAATIADVAGFKWGADGVSLVPLLTQQRTSVRHGLLFEECEGISYPCLPDVLAFTASDAPSSWGIVTSQYKYIDSLTGEKELYDLTADPWEMVNHDGDPNYLQIESNLQTRLAALKAEPTPDTTIISGPTGALDDRAARFTYFSPSRFSTYQCRIDTNGVPGPWTPCNGGSVIEGPLGDGSYTFEVKGTNELGVTDPTPDTRDFTITGSGPDITITSAPPAHTKTRKMTFKFTSQAPGATFECQLSLFGQSSPTGFSLCTSPIVYPNQSDGLWEFEVRAVDTGGVKSDPPAESLVNEDHFGPIMTFQESPLSDWNVTNATFSFQASEATSGAITCQLDNGASSDCSTGTYSITGLTDASHTLNVTAYDTLSNRETTSYVWTVDTTTPNTTISSTIPDGGSTTSTTITFTISANEKLDPDKGVGCALDGENLLVAFCSTPTVLLSGLAVGTHVFSVQTYDPARNASDIATWTWTVTT
jgi:N-acetylglucosamine-6-sulfatase